MDLEVDEKQLEMIRIRGSDWPAIKESLGSARDTARKESGSYAREILDLISRPHGFMFCELIYHSDVEGVEDELTRRGTILELTDEELADVVAGERSILENSDIAGRDSIWPLRGYGFSSVENLPDPDHMTLSELIGITDDANYQAAHFHRRLSTPAMKAVGVASTCGDGKYFASAMQRIESYALKGRGEKILSKDCGLIARLRWNMPAKDIYLPDTA